jgi:diaminopimelate epimerase
MKFTKMQATGNDFILMSSGNKIPSWNKLAKEMCDRHFGVGADGLITVDSSNNVLSMRIFNADGSEAEVCGNGLRCFAKYVFDNGIAQNSEIEVNTISGTKLTTAFINMGKVEKIKVDMGSPEFAAKDIPVNIKAGFQPGKDNSSEAIVDYPLDIADENLNLTFINMGNPHAVNFISTDVSQYPLSQIGPKVERHPIFPERTNFEIANLINKKTIEARVWERGVGETLACGSGACAIAVAARVKKLTGNQVDIIMPGGKLTIDWDLVGNVYLTGPVETVFIGDWVE